MLAPKAPEPMTIAAASSMSIPLWVVGWVACALSHRTSGAAGSRCARLAHGRRSYTYAEAEAERATKELAALPTGAVTFEILSAEIGPDENRTGGGEHEECVRAMKFRVMITWPGAYRSIGSMRSSTTRASAGLGVPAGVAWSAPRETRALLPCCSGNPVWASPTSSTRSPIPTAPRGSSWQAGSGPTARLRSLRTSVPDRRARGRGERRRGAADLG